ncbi:MAG: glycosyltransferase family 39 protein [Candidatus Acidiferrales bacterium]
MALITSLLHEAVVILLVLLNLSFGARILHWVGIELSDPLEELVLSAGIAFASLMLVLFVVELTTGLRLANVLIVLGLMAVLSLSGWKAVAKWAGAFCHKANEGRRNLSTCALAILVVWTLLLDGCMALAPLTGSDAMHYHFTTPLLEAGHRAEPIFWLTHSFFTGLAHSIIGLGLALGSEQISLGLIFFGGVFTAAALLALARQILPTGWSLAAVLTFLFTPLTFWQMSVAGSPDVWMAFFVLASVLAAVRGVRESSFPMLILAGFLSGAGAGIKYTGVILPAAIVVGCWVETHSWKKGLGCGLAAIPGAALPLLRNFLWSGDPVFPYLSPWLTPSNFNRFCFHATLMDTRSVHLSRSVFGLLSYFFLMTLRGSEYGFGQFFGPLVLALAPVLMFAKWRSPLVRIAGLSWLVFFLANEISSQMARFLFPVYPLALLLLFNGAHEAGKRGWRAIERTSVTAVAAFLFCGVVAQVFYARNFIPAAAGLEKREAFLDRMAPDYLAAEYINSTLENKTGKVLVFQRHLYYLRVGYLNGDPGTSWPMDPDRLDRPEVMLSFLRDQNIRWVVKSPDYPEPLSYAFLGLESAGILHPVARTEVSEFEGFRMSGQKRNILLTILEVSEAAPARRYPP